MPGPADRGFATPAVLAVILGGLIILGLALDLGRWAFVQREAVFAADAGAQAGAAIIDDDAAYRGVTRLDAGAARSVAIEAALEARPRAGRTASASVAAAEVCVSVRQPFATSLLRVAGVGGGQIRAAACARPAQG